MHKHVISIDIYLYFNYCNHKSTTLIKFKLSTTEQKKLAYTVAKYCFITEMTTILITQFVTNNQICIS